MYSSWTLALTTLYYELLIEHLGFHGKYRTLFCFDPPMQILYIYISRHMAVCRAAKKAGNRNVSIFTGRKKTAFLCVHTSMFPSPKHTIFAL